MKLNTPRTALLLAGATAVGLAVASPANACCVAYDYGDAQTNKQEIITDFNTQLQTTETDIIQALKLMTGQLSGNLKQQTTAESNMKTLQDQRQTTNAIQQATNNAMRGAQSGASTCNVVTGAVGASGTEAAAAAWREQIVQAQVDRDKGLVGAGTQGQAAAITKRMDSHCANGADANDVASGVCTTASANSVNAGHDLNASVMIHPSTGTGQAVTDAHNVLSSADVSASALFLDTAMGSRPFGAVPTGVGKTDAGRRMIAERNASIARMSVAAAAAADVQASKVAMTGNPSVQSGGTSSNSTGAATSSLTSWAEGTAKQTLGYNPGGNNFPNGVSKDAWLELRAKAWFMNPNWAVSVDSHTDASQTAKDLAMISSFQAVQNWELYRQVEQMNLSLATIISILEDDKREKM